MLPIRSVRRFLLGSLLGMLTLGMLALVCENVLHTVTLNRQLTEIHIADAAKIIHVLIENNHDHLPTQLHLDDALHQATQALVTQFAQSARPQERRFSHFYQRYEHEMFFQIWQKHNHTLIMHSYGAPDFHTTDRAHGFDTIEYHKQHWQVFVLADAHSKLRIIVGINQHFDWLETWNMLKHSLLLFALLYAALVGLIIFIIHAAFKPINRIATELHQRKASSLRAISSKNTPEEIVPLVNEINNLFNRIQASIRRQRRFTGDAAHELRTPLATLRMQVEVAIGKKNPEQQQAVLQQLIHSCDRCTHLIEQMLALSRLDPEAKIIYKERVDMGALCEQVLADAFVLADKKDTELALENTLPPHTKILGDTTQLMAMLRNLVDNAIRYCPAHSQVTMFAATQRKSIVLRIVDNGPGIPKNKQKRIFDRFYREPGSNETGSGLGLSIVKEIVTLHGGSIRAVTPKSGVGCEMVVTFPLTRP